MTKEEFFEILRERLSILDENEVNDIIEEYSEHINEKKKKKISESDAIKEFGEIDELVENILSAYKVNKNYINSNKKNNFIDEIVDNAKNVFEKIIQIISHGTGKEIFSFIIYVAVILLLIAIFRIPFNILENALTSHLYRLPQAAEDVITAMVALVINLSYIVISFIIVIKLLNEKLLDNVKFERIEKIVNNRDNKKDATKKHEKSSDKEVKEEKIVEEKIVYKNERTFLDSLGDLVIFILKFFAVIFLFPTLICIICAAIAFITLLIFSIKYVLFVGPIICALGALLGCIWIAERFFRFILGKPSTFVSAFITFIVSLVLFGAGIGVTIVELTSYDFKPAVREEVLLEEKDFNIKEVDSLNCYACDSRLITDSSLKDDEYKVKVKGSEYQKAYFRDEDYYYDDNNEEDRMWVYISALPDDFIKQVFEDIKSGYIYDYTYADDMVLEVYANSNTIEKVKIIRH